MRNEVRRARSAVCTNGSRPRACYLCFRPDCGGFRSGGKGRSGGWAEWELGGLRCEQASAGVAGVKTGGGGWAEQEGGVLGGEQAGGSLRAKKTGLRREPSTRDSE